jgi:2-methylcitrate dehydratase PrpD
MQSATAGMAEYLVGLKYSMLPGTVVNKCKELVLDALACGIRGSKTPIGEAVTHYARDIGGNPQATILGSQLRSACPTAAYVNASSINAMDYDDTGKGGHPGSTTIAAALSLGEKLGVSGKEFLLACVTGYEISTRVAAAIEPTWERYRQVHGVGTAQTFGSMAACAKLLGLGLEKTLNCFGVAGATAPVSHAGKFGWKDKSIPFIKDNVAWPAEAGLRAALLADLGYEGSESILDGDRGYWVMAGSDRCNFGVLTDFSKYQIMGVSLKPYPCCRWIHTTLDILKELQREHALDLDRIKRIDLYSIEPIYEFFGEKEPRTFIDVEFSIPFSVALKMNKVPHSRWFEAESWKNHKVALLASKVNVHFDKEYQDLYLKLNRQSARIPARMEIELTGGKKITGYRDDAWGSPTCPMSREDRLEKTRDLLSHSLTAEEQERFIQTIAQLEEIDNISKLGSYLLA